MTVRWLSVAESDFSEALDYYLYDEQSPAAAAAFADEIDAAIMAIQNSPMTFLVLSVKSALSSSKIRRRRV